MPKDTPKITVLSTEWRKNMCERLGLVYQHSIIQPLNLVGERISYNKAGDTESIQADGNCFFRCLSKILTGNENSHIQLRAIISRFIASERTTQLAWYFRQKVLTPCDYLLDEKLISMDGVWAGDVEIMAASAILEADIYVATDDYTVEGSIVRDIRWSLLRACPSPQAAIYIQILGVISNQSSL